jgi:hypothetical protein
MFIPLLLLGVAQARDARTGVAPFVGVQAGPAFPLSDLGPAVLPRLELGVELPPIGRRLRLFVAGQYLRPLGEGQGQEPRLAAGGYEYTLRQHELAFALGPTLRIPDLSAVVVPEASVGPQIYLHQSKVDGSAGGEPFGESVEEYTRVGGYASIGAAVVLGPAELVLQVAFTSSGLNGVVTGAASGAAIAPLLGVRFVPLIRTGGRSRRRGRSSDRAARPSARRS